MTDKYPPATPRPEDWKCEACEGSGQAIPDCESCEGKGWVDDDEDGGTMTCPECDDDKCDVCKGTGERHAPVAKRAAR